MLTITAIVAVLEGEFQRYVTDLLPHLLVGLQNWQAHTVFHFFFFLKNCYPLSLYSLFISLVMQHRRWYYRRYCSKSRSKYDTSLRSNHHCLAY